MNRTKLRAEASRVLVNDDSHNLLAPEVIRLLDEEEKLVGALDVAVELLRAYREEGEPGRIGQSLVDAFLQEGRSLIDEVL